MDDRNDGPTREGVGLFSIGWDGGISWKRIGYFPAFGHDVKSISYLVRGPQPAGTAIRRMTRRGRPELKRVCFRRAPYYVGFLLTGQRGSRTILLGGGFDVRSDALD